MATEIAATIKLIAFALLAAEALYAMCKGRPLQVALLSSAAFFVLN